MTVGPRPGLIPCPGNDDAPSGRRPAGVPVRATAPTAAGSGMTACQPSMLADTAARERAIGVLKAGLAEGRLTRAEHDERAARAHAARTYGDLAPLVSDLPSGVPGAVLYYPRAQDPVPPTFNSLAVASLICGLAEIPTLGPDRSSRDHPRGQGTGTDPRDRRARGGSRASRTSPRLYRCHDLLRRAPRPHDLAGAASRFRHQWSHRWLTRHMTRPDCHPCHER
jgi:hypothetical protein